MAVRDYARAPVFTVDPQDSLRSAAELMEKEGVGCVVVTEAGKPVGVLTDRDLVLEVLCKGLDAGAVRVGQATSRSVTTIHQDATATEATRLIRRQGVRRLPVVDDAGALVGLLSADDLMRLAVGDLARLADAVREQALAEPVEG